MNRNRLMCLILTFMGTVTTAWCAGVHDTIKDSNKDSEPEVVQVHNPASGIPNAEDCLRNGINCLEAKDYENASDYFFTAYVLGEPKAAFYLGLMELKGQTVTRMPNPDRAEKYFMEAVDGGIADAAVNLATMYVQGIGVERDINKAYGWVRKGAEMGDAGAQHMLGVMIARGQGTEMNQTEGLQWMLKAAEQGLPIAQQDAAIMYLNGRGVEQSYEDAFRWMLKAAENGLATAQFMVGSFYFQGQGVPKDEKAALDWTKKAARQGEPRALKVVEFMNIEL